MKYRFLIRLLLGLLIIIILSFVGFKMINWLSDFVIDLFIETEFVDNGYENDLITPEPMPTMPDYIGEDSFYDSAGSVDFTDE